MDLKRTQVSGVGGTSILTTWPVGWAVGTFWCLVQSKPLPSGFAPGDWLTFVLKTKLHWEFSLRALRGHSKNKACLPKGSWLMPWRTTFCRGVHIAYRWCKTERISQVSAAGTWQLEDLLTVLFLNIHVPQIVWEFWFPLLLSPGGDNHGNHCCFAVLCKISLWHEKKDLGGFCTTFQIIS